MNDIETTSVVRYNSDDSFLLSSDGQPLQTTLSADSSILMVEESPPVSNTSSQTRRTLVYPDDISNAPFCVQINSKSNFNRDDYQLDEEEFNIVGIIGDIGQGDSALYEVQFEDGHTAIVPTQLSCFAYCSSQSTNFFATTIATNPLRNI